MTADPTFEPSPFDRPGHWLRGGFHCHTLQSDGGLSPAETVACYRARGYQVLGITDHAMVTDTGGLSGDGIVALPSTENGGDPDIIGVGVDAAVPPEWSLANRARALADQGGFTIAAHPTYCAATPADYLRCPDLMAMEILNAYCDEAYANGYATELWDMLLGQGKRIWGVAGDDAHLNPRKRYYSDAGRAWVEIWAAEQTPSGILAALKSGAFYSTQGPRFASIRVAGPRIEVECSPVAQVRWRTYGSVGFVDHAPDGAPLTRSALPESYNPRVFVRVELVDADGKRAWSNPIFVK